MARSNEPLFWLPFFAGAGFAAFFMPVVILITIVAGKGGIAANDLADLLEKPLTRLFLFILISLSLFHAVHRIRYILVDLGLKSGKGVIAALCYGFAIMGTLVAALLAVHLWS